MPESKIDETLRFALESFRKYFRVDIEGVEKELIFPQRLFGLYIISHEEMREEIFSIYNEDIAKRCAQGDGRLYPVMIPNFWDLTKSRASMERIRASTHAGWNCTPALSRSSWKATSCGNALR